MCYFRQQMRVCWKMTHRFILKHKKTLWLSSLFLCCFVRCASHTEWCWVTLRCLHNASLLMHSKYKNVVFILRGTFSDCEELTREHKTRRSALILSDTPFVLPLKTFWRKINNTNKPQVLFPFVFSLWKHLKLFCHQLQWFCITSSSTHLARLIGKEKSESSTQWDINSCTSYSTYSYVRLASSNAREMNMAKKNYAQLKNTKWVTKSCDRSAGLRLLGLFSYFFFLSILSRNKGGSVIMHESPNKKEVHSVCSQEQLQPY